MWFFGCLGGVYGWNWVCYVGCGIMLVDGGYGVFDCWIDDVEYRFGVDFKYE